MNTRLPHRLAGAFAIALELSLAATAAPPLEPLSPPDYSLDRYSPAVLTGLVQAADILRVSQGQRTIVVEGHMLGLLSTFDELDGLSGGVPGGLPAGTTFGLLFSVDRATLGLTPPDPFYFSIGLPYNAYDQARRGHAAGDQFLVTLPFGGGVPRLAANSILVRNNYDEGGTDFLAEPNAHAYTEYAALRVAQDNVDGHTIIRRNPLGQPVFVYFSASADSPSLITLPGPPSGANLYFNPTPLGGSQFTQLYAPFDALGLTSADDIDALIVSDVSPLGVYSTGDRVLFSLTPNSPSLRTIPGASAQGAAADVFVVTFGQSPHVLANAELLGLGLPQDNIDALDVLLCPNLEDCIRRNSIRIIRGDTNCDGAVNFKDINPFVLALSAPQEYERVYDCTLLQADCNADHLVDFQDINPFVAILSGQSAATVTPATPRSAEE